MLLIRAENNFCFLLWWETPIIEDELEALVCCHSGLLSLAYVAGCIQEWAEVLAFPPVSVFVFYVNIVFFGF